MNCGCAICKDNKPFDFPQEIIEATLNGELAFFAEQELVPKGKIFYRFPFILLLKKNWA